jgi:hypothetical protein
LDDDDIFVEYITPAAILDTATLPITNFLEKRIECATSRF